MFYQNCHGDFFQHSHLIRVNKPKFYMADVRKALLSAGKEIFYLKTNSYESLMQIRGTKKIIR